MVKRQKYRVTDEKGARFLLRISEASLYNKKKHEFEMMQRAATLGIPMCLPVESGLCEEGVYSIRSWIGGENAGDLIPRLSE